MTSRGCPYRCIYCPVGLTSGKKMRLRSARNIYREIEYWYSQGYRSMDLWDDNFTISSKRVHEFCDMLLAGKMKDLCLNVPNGIRADCVDRELLKKMKASGFRKIAFGVEGGNDKILRRLKKGERMESIEKAIKNACEIGFDVVLFFIIGTPGESWEDIEDSFRLAGKYPVAAANFYNLIPFPKTELFEWVNANGYLLMSPEKYLSSASQFANEPCFQTPELSASDRKKAFVQANRISKKVKAEWVKRKFSKSGLLSVFLSIIYTNETFNRLLFRKRGVYKFIEIAKQLLLKERKLW
ncbi:MAG: B12-binding domain-containing radical SAM protein [Calditrichia bacterium]